MGTKVLVGLLTFVFTVGTDCVGEGSLRYDKNHISTFRTRIGNFDTHQTKDS